MKKVEVKYKQVGRNLTVIIDGEKLTKTGDKEQLVPIKEAVALYENKPLVKNLKALKDLLKTETVKKEVEKEKIRADIKKVKHEAKRTTKVKTEVKDIKDLLKLVESGKLPKKQLEELQKAIAKHTKAKVEEPVAKTDTIKSRYREH